MKKILAAVMAAATFASAISFSAFAADISTDSHNPMMNDFPLTVFSSAPTLNKTDVAQPESKFFIMIPDGGSRFSGKDYTDKDLYTVSAKAVEGAKYVKSISRVSKTGLGTGAQVISNGFDIYGVTDLLIGNTATRAEYIQVELKPDYTANEYKVQLEISVKSKAKSGDTGSAKVETHMLYMGNAEVTYDTYDAGQKGQVFKPTKNEENEIVWNDDIRDIARLTFIADSDVAKTYPKLNTKWSESDYRDYFNDQDAFLFEFVGNHYVSSTSRAVLEIYNPYYNADNDEVTVDGEEVIIYQVTEEGLVDVSAQFNYGENEDGDLVFTTKLRQLGTYIFAEQEVATEEEIEDVPTNPVGPVNKIPANTGR